MSHRQPAQCSGSYQDFQHQREREREVKILKLTISITDRESDFISTFTDNPLQEDTLCMDIYWGYHTNITIYNLYLS